MGMNAQSLLPAIRASPWSQLADLSPILEHFDRDVIGERNEGIRRRVQTLRLDSQHRENGGPRPGSRLASFVSKCTLPLLRTAGLTG